MSHATCFRTYFTPSNPAHNCTIWEACRATSASWAFFDAIEIGDSIKERFIGGSILCCNPVARVVEEACTQWSEDSNKVSCLVSIGTGNPGVIRETSDYIETLNRLCNDCEKAEHDWTGRLSGPKTVYIRLSIEQGMQSIKDDELDAFSTVKSHTHAYLRNVSDSVDMVVERLMSRVPICKTAELCMSLQETAITLISNNLIYLSCPNIQPTHNTNFG